jgi:hypothetical protein
LMPTTEVSLRLCMGCSSLCVCVCVCVCVEVWRWEKGEERGVRVVCHSVWHMAYGIRHMAYGIWRRACRA